MISENISISSYLGPVVLVTGGARRIGRAIAEDLSAYGFAVAIHVNRSLAEGEKVATSIRSRGGKAAVFVADLCDINAVQALIGRVETEFGPVRLLINNASLFENDSLGSLSEKKWDRHFFIHVKAPIFLAEAMASGLPANTDGMIINLIDQRVWKLNPQFFSYTLSKSALWTATRTMAQALAPHIRVNAIGPGPTLPNERQKPEDFQRQVEALILKKPPNLSDFGRTIYYLWQVKSITGQMFALDGGQHLAWETPDIIEIPE